MTERPFAPTAARREQARRKGQAPRGRDLTPIAVVISALLVILLGGQRIGTQLTETFQSGIANGAVESGTSDVISGGPASPMLTVNADQVVRIGQSTMLTVANIALPMIAVIMLVAIASQWGQVGFRWLPDRVSPDLSRVDPLSGSGRLFQLGRGIDGALILVRFATALLVVGCSLWFSRDRLVEFGDPVRSLSELPSAATWVLLTASVALAVVAIVDYGLRCWLFEKQLWMTAEEMRNESEGRGADLRVESLTTDAKQRMRQQLQESESSFSDAI